MQIQLQTVKMVRIEPESDAPCRRAAGVAHLERLRRRVAADDVEAPVGVRSAVRFARAVHVGARSRRRIGQGPDLRPDARLNPRVPEDEKWP